MIASNIMNALVTNQLLEKLAEINRFVIASGRIKLEWNFAESQESRKLCYACTKFFFNIGEVNFKLKKNRTCLCERTAGCSLTNFWARRGMSKLKVSKSRGSQTSSPHL